MEYRVDYYIKLVSSYDEEELSRAAQSLLGTNTTGLRSRDREGFQSCVCEKACLPEFYFVDKSGDIDDYGENFSERA